MVTETVHDIILSENSFFSKTVMDSSKEGYHYSGQWVATLKIWKVFQTDILKVLPDISQHTFN